MQSVKVELGQKNCARLEQKQYGEDYTNIPNTALPEGHREQLGYIYQALTGEPLPVNGSTYTVKSEDGVFRRLYTPALVKSEENQLMIKWGDTSIPLEVVDGKLKSEKTKSKIRFSFKDDQIKEDVTLTYLILTVTANKVLYILDCPVIQADYENPVRCEVLNVLLDEDPNEITEHIGVMGGDSIRLQGPIIKTASLPDGEYQVTGFRRFENKKYGPRYTLQVVIPASFKAEVNRKNDKDEWESVETTIEPGYAQVKANSQLRRALSADPVIDEENPATLEVIEHGEFNGYATAKVKLIPSSYEEDESSLKLSF